jgi:putative oxidoreductase
VYSDLGLLILRLAVGGVIFAHGAIKIGWPVSMSEARGGAALRSVAGWFGSLGFWPAMFWAVVSLVAEFVGGILIILGLGGPIGPGLVFGDMIVVTLVAHWSNGFWVTKNGWEFPILLVAGSFAVALVGFGAWSLDAALSLTYADWLAPVWLVVTAIGAGVLLVIRASRQASNQDDAASASSGSAR